MFVIIKKIHPSITIEDIEGYVTPVIKAEAELLKKHGVVKAIQIVEIVDKHGKPIERHGLVRVGPDNIIKQLVKALNRCTLNNSRYVVDEYFIRHWRNERRSTKSVQHSFPNNKRKIDRRRRGVKKITLFEKIHIEHHE